MALSKPVLTVTQLNTYVRAVMEQDVVLQNVFVAGEISNFTNHYRTGHLYMSLKDENSLIKAVMFRSSAQRLKFIPENGMKVLCRGRVSLYERDGAYQLYLEDMQPDGAGALSVAFEQLKRKLESEGLFEAGHKRPIPRFPQRIAVITSPTGAAVQDIFNVLSRRYPLAEIVMCPVQVQGENAAPQLISAVRRIDEAKASDVIIIGRGGGSMEDLWAFNSETLARTIYDCTIPVISAVGHETDFTICDFVSDVRAPTPSAAAELAVPDRAELISVVLASRARLRGGLSKTLQMSEEQLRIVRNSPVMRTPERLFERQSLEFDRLSDRLKIASRGMLERFENRLHGETGKLEAFAPLRVLRRGYAVTESAGKIITAAGMLSPGDPLTVRFADGRAVCRVEEVERQPESQKISPERSV